MIEIIGQRPVAPDEAADLPCKQRSETHDKQGARDCPVARERTNSPVIASPTSVTSATDAA